MSIALGCIGDDFTGSTDLANNLVRSGLRVVMTNGVPQRSAPLDADAVVVALKSRNISPADAIEQSLGALTWLHAAGAQQFYFKVCSTFDSSASGNIGPVTEALMDALGTDFCCVAPAFPETRRTLYMGHLFVGDLLLSDSGMRHHPLTPMTDANLVRVLQAQCSRHVGLIEHTTVRAGATAIHLRIAALRGEGVGLAIIDALDDHDLQQLSMALANAPLVVASAGLALGVARGFIRGRIQPTTPHADDLPRASGHKAVVSGSCSTATRSQVLRFVEAGLPAFAIDPLRIAAGIDVVGETLALAEAQLGSVPVLVYSAAVPADVKAAQEQLGGDDAGKMVERTLANIALGLVQRGVRQLLVAGGETAGACVQALGVESMSVGSQVDPGVPWCHADSPFAPEGIHLALKSGNFGAPDIFTRAFAELP